MKKLVLAAVLICPSAAFADFIGVHGSLSSWQGAFKGEVAALAEKEKRDALQQEIPTFEDRGFSKDAHTTGWIAIEHPVPILPNFRLGYTSAESKGSSPNEISVDKIIFNYNGVEGVTWEGKQNVYTKMTLNAFDGTFYWEVLDNWVNLDLGFTLRKLDGEFYEFLPEETNLPMGLVPGGLESCDRAGYPRLNMTINGFIRTTGCTRPPTAKTTPIDMIIPLLYAKTQFDLPLSGLYSSLTLQALSDGDNGMVDIEAEIGYMFDFTISEFGIAVGYRRATLTSEDLSDLYADSSLDGYYAGLKFHF